MSSERWRPDLLAWSNCGFFVKERYLMKWLTHITLTLLLYPHLSLLGPGTFDMFIVIFSILERIKLIIPFSL